MADFDDDGGETFWPSDLIPPKSPPPALAPSEFPPGHPRHWDDDAPPDDIPGHMFGGEYGEPVRPVQPIRASPFIWRPEGEIPPRLWLYGKHLIRQFVSVDVAAGGVGKSAVKVGEALAMASGRALYGREVHGGPLTVWLYNLEDPADEIERRIHATARHFGIKPGDVAGRLYVDSGRAQACVIAIETAMGAQIVAPVVEQLKAEIKARGVDVLTVDPFVSCHEVSENDDQAINAVTKAWTHLADECSIAVNLVHQIRKANGTESNADSARGAKALIDGARSVIVYNRMTADEAALASVPAAERGFYFRTQNDKANLAPPESAQWYRMNEVKLANGDSVGVACPWEWPGPFSGINTASLRTVQAAIAEGEWRRDPRAPNWAGFVVADVCGLDSEADAQRISAILKAWTDNGALRVVVRRDVASRKDRQFVEVGDWATE